MSENQIIDTSEEDVVRSQQQLGTLHQDNQELTDRIQDAHDTNEKNLQILADNNSIILKLEEEVTALKAQLEIREFARSEKYTQLQQLREEKRTQIAQQFAMPGLGESYSIQDILDVTEAQDEMLWFKDSHGLVWEVVRESSINDGYSEDDEKIHIDPMVEIFSKIY